MSKVHNMSVEPTRGLRPRVAHLYRWAKKPAMNDCLRRLLGRNARWCFALLLLLAVGVGWFISARPDQWAFRRALPWSASDVHEWIWSETLLPDYSYHLKARVTEEEFGRYTARFGLTPHAETRQYSEAAPLWLSWRTPDNFKGDWWTPSETLNGTFVANEGRTWTFAKYEHGYLYLASLAH